MSDVEELILSSKEVFRGEEAFRNKTHDPHFCWRCKRKIGMLSKGLSKLIGESKIHGNRISIVIIDDPEGDAR